MRICKYVNEHAPAVSQGALGQAGVGGRTRSIEAHMDVFAESGGRS